MGSSSFGNAIPSTRTGPAMPHMNEINHAAPREGDGRF
jgi:hypothetical protein